MELKVLKIVFILTLMHLCQCFDYRNLFSSSSKQCHSCLNTDGKKWCQPKTSSSYGKCCSIDDSEGPCSSQESNCSDSDSLPDSDLSMILCPANQGICGTQVHWDSGNQSEFSFHSSSIEVGDLCWYQLKKTSNNPNKILFEITEMHGTPNVRVFKKTASQSYEAIEVESEEIGEFELEYQESAFVLIEPENESSSVSFKFINQMFYEEEKQNRAFYSSVVGISASIVLASLLISLFIVCLRRNRSLFQESHQKVCLETHEIEITPKRKEIKLFSFADSFSESNEGETDGADNEDKTSLEKSKSCNIDIEQNKEDRKKLSIIVAKNKEYPNTPNSGINLCGACSSGLPIIENKKLNPTKS